MHLLVGLLKPISIGLGVYLYFWLFVLLYQSEIEEDEAACHRGLTGFTGGFINGLVEANIAALALTTPLAVWISQTGNPVFLLGWARHPDACDQLCRGMIAMTGIDIWLGIFLLGAQVLTIPWACLGGATREREEAPRRREREEHRREEEARRKREAEQWARERSIREQEEAERRRVEQATAARLEALRLAKTAALARLAEISAAGSDTRFTVAAVLTVIKELRQRRPNLSAHQSQQLTDLQGALMRQIAATEQAAFATGRIPDRQTLERVVGRYLDQCLDILV